MSELLTISGLVSLLTLTLMELVLGIDNIIFLSVLTSKLPRERQSYVRRVGLFLAMFMRVGLLFAISAVTRLKATLFTIPVLGAPLSGREIILLSGGLFLMAKSTHEIFGHAEAEDDDDESPKPKEKLAAILLQIVAMDLVLSLDSVIAAVGVARNAFIMSSAVVLAVGMMMFFAGPIGDFVNRHPSMKLLALSFLLLIGVLLVAEAMGTEIPKGYLYFAMAYSVLVELLHMRNRRAAAAKRAARRAARAIATAADETPEPTQSG